MKVILACGVIGAGKDFFLKKYIRENPNEKVVQLKFALPIRQFAGKYYGVDLIDEKSYEAWKEDNREKLVAIGQYMKEVVGEDIWARGVVNQIKENCTYIITDFRFPVEFFTVGKEIDLRDISIVFCNFPSKRYALKPEQTTERMACWLVKQGFKDGKEWSYYHFEKVMKRYQDSLLSTK